MGCGNVERKSVLLGQGDWSEVCFGFGKLFKFNVWHNLRRGRVGVGYFGGSGNFCTTSHSHSGVVCFVMVK